MSQIATLDRIRGMKLIFKLFFILFFQCFGNISNAHPTSYEGGFALMSEAHHTGEEVSLIYSPKFWLGTGVVWLSEDDQYEMISSQVGWLAKRWNLPSAQGNIYLIGGLGYGKLLDLNNSDGLTYRLGLQADYETRRVYTFLRFVENRFFEKDNLVNNDLSAAVGFAPYLANFSELNSWVIFKTNGKQNLENWNYTIILRFFYKNFLWEIGKSFDGNSHLNFMVRF